MQPFDTAAWDAYIQAHPKATLYHLSGWKNIIERTYGHKTYYLMATKKNSQPIGGDQRSTGTDEQNVVGILPFVHLRHFLFGNRLISLPFFDMGGILANDGEVEKLLLVEAVRHGKRLNVDNIELRNIHPLSWFDQLDPNNSNSSATYVMRSHKVRMLFNLPDSSETLMKSFKSKLRSQIRKPLKEGLIAKTGGLELLDDFYKVFSINMRDLGSPVHSINLMKSVLEEFIDRAKIVVVYKDAQPLACSMMVGFKDTLQNPWASALKQYSHLSPNMLLYWTMLEYACDNGYSHFDFGRSSSDEGTYRFKKQWGAKPFPLFWHNIYLNRETEKFETIEKSKFARAVKIWQKIPVKITKIIGPLIRKNIDL